MTEALRQLIFMGNDGTIAEDSKVRLSLVIGICAVLIGCIWWAASLQAKVDALLSNSAHHITTDRNQSDAITDMRHTQELLKLRIQDLETRYKATH